jgi:hypothetical protein
LSSSSHWSARVGKKVSVHRQRGARNDKVMVTCAIWRPPSDGPDSNSSRCRASQCPTCRESNHSAKFRSLLHTVSICPVVKMNPRIIIVAGHSGAQEREQECPNTDIASRVGVLLIFNLTRCDSRPGSHPSFPLSFLR